MTHIPPRPPDSQLFRTTNAEVALDFPHLSSSSKRMGWGNKIGSRSGGFAVAQFDLQQTGGIKTVAYSYGTPIGILVTLGQADISIVTCASWSVTTSAHQSSLSSKGCEFLLRLPIELDKNAHRLFEACCEELVRSYRQRYLNAANAKSRGPGHISHAEYRKGELEAFGQWTGLDVQPYLVQMTWDHLTDKQKAKLVALRMK